MDVFKNKDTKPEQFIRITLKKAKKYISK